MLKSVTNSAGWSGHSMGLVGEVVRVSFCVWDEAMESEGVVGSAGDVGLGDGLQAGRMLIMKRRLVITRRELVFRMGYILKVVRKFSSLDYWKRIR